MKAKDIYIFDAIEDSESYGVSAKRILNEISSLQEGQDLHLHINSPGGDVYQGVTIYNLLKQSKAYVTAHVYGIAASIASVIAMGADRIIMHPGSMMMIHNPSSLAYGEKKDMLKMAEKLDQVKESLISNYTEKTNLSRNEVAKMMDNETYLTAEDAVKYGFADEVRKLSEPMAAKELLKASMAIFNPSTVDKLTNKKQMETENKTPEQSSELEELKKQNAELLAQVANLEESFKNSLNDVEAAQNEIELQKETQVKIEAKAIADIKADMELYKDTLLSGFNAKIEALSQEKYLNLIKSKGMIEPVTEDKEDEVTNSLDEKWQSVKGNPAEKSKFLNENPNFLNSKLNK